MAQKTLTEPRARTTPARAEGFKDGMNYHRILDIMREYIANLQEEISDKALMVEELVASRDQFRMHFDRARVFEQRYRNVYMSEGLLKEYDSISEDFCYELAASKKPWGAKQ